MFPLFVACFTFLIFGKFLYADSRRLVYYLVLKYKAEKSMIIEANEEHSHFISQILQESIENEAIHHYGNDADTLNYWLSDKSIEDIKEQFSKQTDTFYLLLEGENFIGVGSISNDGEINRCYIKSSHLKKGYGSQLLQHIMNQKRHDANSFSVFSSLGAISFYEKHGFVQTGLLEMWGPMKMTQLRKVVASKTTAD